MNLLNANWHATLIRERDQGVQDGGGDVKLNLDDEEKYRMEKSPMYWQSIAGESMADVSSASATSSRRSACSAKRASSSCATTQIHAFRILLEEIPQEQQEGAAERDDAQAASGGTRAATSRASRVSTGRWLVKRIAVHRRHGGDHPVP